MRCVRTGLLPAAALAAALITVSGTADALTLECETSRRWDDEPPGLNAYRSFAYIVTNTARADDATAADFYWVQLFSSNNFLGLTARISQTTMQFNGVDEQGMSTRSLQVNVNRVTGVFFFKLEKQLRASFAIGSAPHPPSIESGHGTCTEKSEATPRKF